MGLHRDDKEFRYPGISYLDYKQIDMDRVLTGLLPRLWWRGSPSVLVGSRGDLSVDTFVESFLEHPDQFKDFDPDVTYRWVETHLLDVVNRGRPTQAVAGLRPLHGFTYRYRVSRRSRPYGADEQLYWMIYQASGMLGTRTLDHLRQFFFAGVDPRTASPNGADEIDVETQALINLAQVAEGATDRAAPGQPRRYPPLDQAACDRLAEDVMRLLYHQEVIPRSVLVDHLKILFALHLALYHLRAMKSLPARLARAGGDAAAGAVADGRGGLFVDVAGVPGTACARLAERSARRWYCRIPAFVQTTFAVKKLDDFKRQLQNQGKLRRLSGSSRDGTLSVDQLLSLLGTQYRTERNGFAESRKSRVLKDLEGPDRELDPEIAGLAALGLDPFTTYIELVTAQRVAFHRKYLTECLDTLLLKNRPGALVAQPRGSERRFVLDSRLVEVLLQLALLRPDDRTGEWRTVPLRVDEFLRELKNRYGLYIDEFPPGDDLGRPGIADQAALRANRAAFVARLREIGFYTDLSDAYITQTILPRYRLGAGEP